MNRNSQGTQMRRFFFFCFFTAMLSWFDAGQALVHAPVSSLVCHIKNKAIHCLMISPVKLQIQHFFLKKPDRWVIDIPNAKFTHRPYVQMPHNFIIKNCRFSSLATAKKLRIVFDLNQKVSLKIAQSNVRGHYQLQFIITPLSPFKKKIERFFNAYPAPSMRKITVVIDPGHGGKDPGARGQRGLQEKNIVLAISRRIQRQLNQQPGFVAVLTRKEDRYLTLRQRLSMARRYRPDVFIAIHADAYPQKNAVGASVYALSLRGATSEAALWLANKENASELMGGVDLSGRSDVLKSVLLDLSQMATIRASLKLGDHMIRALRQLGPLHHEKVEQAAFVVLKSPDIPSLLIETGFITNAIEERKLSSSLYQEQLATSITHGIRDYFTQYPPRGTFLAQRLLNPVGFSK